MLNGSQGLDVNEKTRESMFIESLRKRPKSETEKEVEPAP
jgi:hypothetical protein